MAEEQVKRDPRTNPKPGDLLCKGKFTRSVVAIHGHEVEYTRYPGTDDRACWITTWREWARKAEVTHAAE